VRLSSGWVVVWSVAVTELISWGVLIYAFSVLLVPMQAELGWSAAQLTGAYSGGLLVSGLVAVPVGRWLDARGPRGLMTAGSALTVLVLLAWAEVDSLVAFYAVFAVAGLAMATTLYEPAFAIAAGRPRAVLVLTIFGGLASVVFVPLCGVLVTELGWRDALLVLAAIVAVVCLPIHGLIVRAPPAERRGATRGEVLRSRSFRWLAVSLTLSTLGRVAVSVHLVAYLVERGYALEDAALAGGGIGLLQVVGRVAATGLRTLVPEHIVFSGFLLLQGLSVTLLLATAGRATPAVVAFVLLYGIAFGLPELMRGVLVADFYGTEHYASINGALALFVTSARALAPVAAGASRTLTGGYTAMLVTAGAVAVLSAGALLAAHRAHARERVSVA
jgi:MFS family permease